MFIYIYSYSPKPWKNVDSGSSSSERFFFFLSARILFKTALPNPKSMYLGYSRPHTLLLGVPYDQLLLLLSRFSCV